MKRNERQSLARQIQFEHDLLDLYHHRRARTPASAIPVKMQIELRRLARERIKATRALRRQLLAPFLYFLSEPKH